MFGKKRKKVEKAEKACTLTKKGSEFVKGLKDLPIEEQNKKLEELCRHLESL